MKKVFLSGFFLMFVFCMYAIDQQNAPKQNVSNSVQAATVAQAVAQPAMTPEQFKVKINELINERRQVSMQIYQQRVYLIKEDPDLRILHKTILDLHTKMAKQLNVNPKIVPLMDKGKEIDSEIEKLVKTYQPIGDK